MKILNVKLSVIFIIISCILMNGVIKAEQFDLKTISIGTGIGDPSLHEISVIGSSPETPERILVSNPNNNVVADSDTAGLEWNDALSAYQLFSGHLDSSTLFSGEYKIEVFYSGASEIRMIDVPENLFCSEVPTGFEVINPQPTFAWDPFVSSWFDPATEYLTYMVEVGIYTEIPEIVCWRGHLDETATQANYNFDASAEAGYGTLPPGLYSAFLFATENQVGISTCLNISSDSYNTSRTGLQEISFTVVPIPGAFLLGILGLSVAGVKLRKRA